MPKRCLCVFLMLLLLTGCSSQTPAPSRTTGTAGPSDPAKGEYYADYENGLVVAGTWETAELSDGPSGQVSYNDVFPGTPGKDHTDPAIYTRRDYISGTSGMNWGPLTWETRTDAYVRDLITTGFYSFALNSNADGFTVVDEMAQGAPRDVTADYAGRFGIADGDTARAWQIDLNPAACWENGEPIDADTYIYSYQQLLDSKMMNRRADSLYAGDFTIVGARDYLYQKTYPQTGWDRVGILKTGDYQLVFITTAPVASPEFYVPYYLSDTFLVYEPLWEQCKTYLDSKGSTVTKESSDIASITTSYCTSLATTVSYGPYKLSYFERDKRIALERNTAWYGYADGKHLGQYQTDKISCQVIANHATALLAFLNGELDSIGLESADMSKYAASEAIRYAPQSYTTKLSFNTDPEALAQRGTQLLSNPLLRKAFSLAIDRSAFAAAYTSAGSAGYGLLNELYVYDPFTGDTYRQTDGAKNALVQLYGLDVAEFGGLQQAYDAITGYDADLARQLMQTAYDQCVAQGLYDGSSPVKLRLSVYQSQDIYVQMFNFLSSALENACRGTDFENKLSMEMVVDEDYYATMESGLTDMIFSTWGGSAYDPYSLLYQCYCDKGVAEVPNQMEYGFDAGAVAVQLTVDGEICRDSLQNWARWCAADPEVTIGSLKSFGDYDAATRAAIYADLEFAYLSQYAVAPLYYRNEAQLVSNKGDYALQNYMGLVEFGGLQFYSYRYSDAQWETVKDQQKY